MTLTEKDGKTIYTAVSTLPDVESRDAMLASGMEIGVVEGLRASRSDARGLEGLGVSRDLTEEDWIMEGNFYLPADNDRVLVITRVLNAPRALVWRAFSDPAHLSRWWGPHGFTNPVCELDFRVGGRWHNVMRTPEGVEYPIDVIFIEIVEPERIVYRNAPGRGRSLGRQPAALVRPHHHLHRGERADDPHDARRVRRRRRPRARHEARLRSTARCRASRGSRRF